MSYSSSSSFSLSPVGVPCTMNIVRVFVPTEKINSFFFYITWFGSIFAFILTIADYFLNCFGCHLVVSCYLWHLTFIFVGRWGCF